MKIFGINFITKKEQAEFAALSSQVSELRNVVIAHEHELRTLKSVFPFDLGQRVYDIALKDAKGKFTKTKPSLKYSIINEVLVDEKNYFGLVKRLHRKDVFTERETAEEFLKFICK